MFLQNNHGNLSQQTILQIRSVALRNALPATSTRSWDRDYTGSALYSGRSSLGESKSSDRNGSSYAAGGYRASNNISPSKSPARDHRKTQTTVEGQTGLWNIGKLIQDEKMKPKFQKLIFIFLFSRKYLLHELGTVISNKLFTSCL